MPIGPESDASVSVSSGWQLVSLVDGNGAEHITAPTTRYNGVVAAGRVTVTVRSSADPQRVGNLTGVFWPTHALALPRLMNEVLQPAD